MSADLGLVSACSPGIASSYAQGSEEGTGYEVVMSSSPCAGSWRTDIVAGASDQDTQQPETSVGSSLSPLGGD
jgi:hypothetical protein